MLYISRCRKMCEVASFKNFKNSLTTVKVTTKTKVAPFYLGHGVVSRLCLCWSLCWLSPPMTTQHRYHIAHCRRSVLNWFKPRVPTCIQSRLDHSINLHCLICLFSPVAALAGALSHPCSTTYLSSSLRITKRSLLFVTNHPSLYVSLRQPQPDQSSNPFHSGRITLSSLPPSLVLLSITHSLFLQACFKIFPPQTVFLSGLPSLTRTSY